MIGRRLLSIGGLAVATALVLGLWPLLAGVAVVVDLVGGRRWATLRFVAFLAVLVTAECIGVVVALAIGRDPERNYALQRAWANALWNAAAWIWSFRLQVEGDPLPDSAFIAMFRHVSYVDTVLPMITMAGPTRFPRYVLKQELAWDPCLDIVGHRVPNVFVRRKGGPDAQLADLGQLARTARSRDFVVIYPEGTRATPAKRAAALARVPAAWASQAAALQHLLPPRPNGPLALLEAGHDVVFAGHVGLEGSATLPSLLSGALTGRTVRVHLRRIAAADVPAEREARIAWLYTEWANMDRWVGEIG